MDASTHGTGAVSEEKNVHPRATLTIDEDRGRAELWDEIDGAPTLIGFIGFSSQSWAQGEPIRLQHTIVHPNYGRRGYARCLVTLLLEELIRQGKTYTSECSYIDQYLSRYPDYRKHQATFS